MPRKVKLILNPMSDMGNSWKAANDLRPIVAEYPGQITWSGTVYPTHAVELARQAGEEGYDMVIAMGGDGTVHEVVNGLMQIPANKRPVLGVVPIGSGNDFAHFIKIPMAADRALAHALNGAATPVDIGKMTDENGRTEFFDNTVGIGFDGIVTIRSHRIPVVRGFLMYFVAVIQTIFLNHKPNAMRAEVDGQSMEFSNIMFTICNAPREGGGFLIAPDARIDDGLLDYLMVSNLGRLRMLRLVPEFMKGTHTGFKEVSMGTCKKFSLKSSLPLYIHADGEIYTSFGSNLHGVTFEILPGALQVVMG
jgi:YegS/Rv2252/BmrU family lipid kinase